jgi:ribosomal protein S2
MGMKLLQIEQLVQSNVPHQDENGFFDRLRRQAADVLAQRIMETSSLYERTDPTEEELRENPRAPIRHRWKIGVLTNMTELEARAKEMDRARRDGLNEAADFLIKQIAYYRNTEGHCKHVLIHQLERMAGRLRELARD